jgi:hypothetical protein
VRHFRIRSVDNGKHLARVGKERNHLLPLAPPHSRHGREFLAPTPWSFQAANVVELQIRCTDAGLDLRLWINRFNGLGEAAQAVNDGDQDIVQSSILQLVKPSARS